MVKNKGRAKELDKTGFMRKKDQILELGSKRKGQYELG
jgi:hypothetical protein